MREQGTDPNHIGSSMNDAAVMLMLHTLPKVVTLLLPDAP